MASWKKQLGEAGALVSTFGLAAFTAAAATGSPGNTFTTGILSTVLGGIFTNIASDMTAPLIERVSGLMGRKHPGQLNHDLQKVLVVAIQDALKNTGILYKEKIDNSGNIKGELEFLKELAAGIPELLSPQSPNQVSNAQLQQYLSLANESGYQALMERLQGQYLAQHFSKDFNQFFKEIFPVQLQVCYAELLKDKSHQPAWIAYQKMLLEETRQGISEIVTHQEKLEKGIQDLHSQKWLEKLSRISPRKTTALKELLTEMNRPQQFEVKFDEALSQRFQQMSQQLQDISVLLKETHRSVKNTERDVLIIRKKLIRYLLWSSAVIIILSVALYGIWYNSQQQPFNLKVIVHDSKGKDERPLKNTGALILDYEGKQEKALIDPGGEALFQQLPSGLMGKEVKIQLSNLNGLPYALLCDTCYTLITRDKVNYLAVRQTGLDSIRGQVTANGYPVSQANVTVNGITAYSDVNGNFILLMPVDKQELRQQLQVGKQGYKTWVNWINSTDWVPVHLEK